MILNRTKNMDTVKTNGNNQVCFLLYSSYFIKTTHHDVKNNFILWRLFQLNKELLHLFKKYNILSILTLILFIYFYENKTHHEVKKRYLYAMQVDDLCQYEEMFALFFNTNKSLSIFNLILFTFYKNKLSGVIYNDC